MTADVPSTVYPPAHARDAQAIEVGRVLFAGPCDFVAGALTADQIPPDTLPEIAFAGRSNVGKSSLLNAITGRAALARVSNTPGRTRQLNFFSLGGKLMLVDLPGYGYAEAPKHEIARWSELLRIYLKGRASLRRTLLLVDARHGLKPIDDPLMTLLDESAVSFQVVLTKVDKLSPKTLAQRLETTAAALKSHVAAHPAIHATSAQADTGLAELRAELAPLATTA
ncbi:MAG TPA: ribosome biogenesis GTP-binding protein YihA/YsxC [Stellaceae bacterium]|nr:ribosome biogenesis GTP-binding protein YihA/YsxC [Stellaceae bacterium]